MAKETKKDDFARVMATDTITGVKKGAPSNAEVEGGEYIQTPDSDVYKADGNKHEQGGIDVFMPNMTKVLSDSLTIPPSIKDYLKKTYNIKNIKDKDTYSDVINKFKTVTGYNRIVEKEKNLFDRVKSNTKSKGSDKTKEINDSYLAQKIKDVAEEKAPKQAEIKELFKDLYRIQQLQKVVSGKSDKEEIPESVEDNGLTDQQMFKIGGMIGVFNNAVKKYNLPPDVAFKYLDKKGLLQNKKYEGGGNIDVYGDNSNPLVHTEQKPLEYIGSLGVDINSSNLKKYADLAGFSDYKGTNLQNQQLAEWAYLNRDTLQDSKIGDLIDKKSIPNVSKTLRKAYVEHGYTSIADPNKYYGTPSKKTPAINPLENKGVDLNTSFKSMGVIPTYHNLKVYADAAGFKDYKGTNLQNQQLAEWMYLNNDKLKKYKTAQDFSKANINIPNYNETINTAFRNNGYESMANPNTVYGQASEHTVFRDGGSIENKTYGNGGDIYGDNSNPLLNRKQSLPVYFNTIGVQPTYQNLRKYAELAGFKNYKGTNVQNQQLAEWAYINRDALQGGDLQSYMSGDKSLPNVNDSLRQAYVQHGYTSMVNPENMYGDTTPVEQPQNPLDNKNVSLNDYFKGIGIQPTYQNLRGYAGLAGFSDYKGTNLQNQQLAEWAYLNRDRLSGKTLQQSQEAGIPNYDQTMQSSFRENGYQTKVDPSAVYGSKPKLNKGGGIGDPPSGGYIYYSPGDFTKYQSDYENKPNYAYANMGASRNRLQATIRDAWGQGDISLDGLDTREGMNRAAGEHQKMLYEQYEPVAADYSRTTVPTIQGLQYALDHKLITKKTFKDKGLPSPFDKNGKLVGFDAQNIDDKQLQKITKLLEDNASDKGLSKEYLKNNFIDNKWYYRTPIIKHVEFDDKNKMDSFLSDYEDLGDGVYKSNKTGLYFKPSLKLHPKHKEQPEGEKEKPLENNLVELQRHRPDGFYPMPDQSFLPPLPLQAESYYPVELGRIDPVRLGIEDTLRSGREVNQFYGSQLKGLPQTVRASLMANQAANIQGKLNQTIDRIHNINAQNVTRANQFNVIQADAEADSNSQRKLNYEQRALLGASKTDQDLRNWYNAMRDVNINNAQEQNVMNTMSNLFPQYSIGLNATAAVYDDQGNPLQLTGNPTKYQQAIALSKGKQG